MPKPAHGVVLGVFFLLTEKPAVSSEDASVASGLVRDYGVWKGL